MDAMVDSKKEDRGSWAYQAMARRSSLLAKMVRESERKAGATAPVAAKLDLVEG